jgi:Dolichyl-phosphate-mannose-protein mannosyltransferase
MRFVFPRGIDLEFVFAKKVVRLSLFFAVLLLALYLRTNGLSWGLTSGYGHYRNFQPDEFISLRGLLEVDLLRGRIKAPSAYFEGTFNYYLWALPQAALKLSSNPAVASTASTEMAGDHSNLLYICRWMSVLFDLSTILIVFLATREATQKFYPSLLGALVYAVLPMQVIYSHFMRTHLLSNFLCALVIWLSLKVRQRQRWWMIFITGVISGLAAATRYPVGVIVAVPCLYLLLHGYNHLSSWRSQLRTHAKRFLTGPIWLIGLGFAFGIFLGHPMLFLDLPAVTHAVKGGALPYASLGEFKAGNLLNLSTVWQSLSFLIPYSMYPILWLLPYGAICYLCFRRGLYSTSLPILLVSLVYLYFMSKGYVVPVFARAMMFLFPGFCILIGLAFDDLLLLSEKRRLLAALLTSALLLPVIPSIIFDLAYGYAMKQNDARSTLRKDLGNLVDNRAVTIGIAHFGGYFYTVMPAVDPLKSEKVEVRLQDLDQKADFFLLGFGAPIDSGLLDVAVKKVEAQGNFTYENTYRGHEKIFGRELRLARFPSDMTYPFPTILLFRAKTEK